MNLLADENFDKPIVDLLRKEGHNVLYVLELTRGIADDEILNLALTGKRMLLTSDKDFGEMVFRRGMASSGVILLRLAGLPPKLKAETLVALLRERKSEIPGNFVVVTPRRVRIRRTIGRNI